MDEGGSTPRRYSDDEVDAIFAEATRSRGPDPTPADGTTGTGLTLAELHEIGREIGVDAGAISRAAAALDVRAAELPRRRYFGFPVGVGRIVDLPGTLTERDWERLVVELRETFDASGQVRRDGALRQWRNGNLQALIEPSATGDRIRMQTVSRRIRAMLGMGFTSLTAGIAFVAVLILTGELTLASAMPILGMFLGIGVWGIAFGVGESFRWSRQREEQMEEIGAKAVALVAASASAALPESREQDPALPPGDDRR